MIRTIFVLLFVVIFLVPVGIPLLFIFWLLGKAFPDAMDRASLSVIQWVLRVIMLLSGVRLTVLGQENLPAKDQPVLYVSNHRSYYDVIIGYTLVHGLTGFVAKKEMKKIPLLSAWMKRLYCVFLDRDNAREGLKTILLCIDQIKHGKSMWICPEGTRNQAEEMIPFKEGSFKIAEKAGCPIVPIAFYRTDDIYENHRPAIRMTHVTVKIGRSIPVAGLDREQKKVLGVTIQDRIQEMYLEMKDTDQEEE